MKENIERLVYQYQRFKSDDYFNQLYEVLFPPLIKHLQYKGLSVEDAEDLLQEYFIKYLKKYLLKYDPKNKCPFLSYIKNILTFRAYDFHRENKTISLPIEYFLERKWEERYIDSDSIVWIKEFTIKTISKIKNPKYRLPILLELIFPLGVPVNEIYQILDIKREQYYCWKERGTRKFSRLILNNKEGLKVSDLKEALENEELDFSSEINSLEQCLEEIKPFSSDPFKMERLRKLTRELTPHHILESYLDSA